MTWENNVYDDPGKFGLAIVAEVNRADSYEFDMFVVWRRVEDGRLLYAEDSGCSCPSPFEDHKLGDLKEFTMDAFDGWLADSYRQPEVSRVRGFKSAVREALNGDRGAV